MSELLVIKDLLLSLVSSLDKSFCDKYNNSGILPDQVLMSSMLITDSNFKQYHSDNIDLINKDINNYVKSVKERFDLIPDLQLENFLFNHDLLKTENKHRKLYGFKLFSKPYYRLNVLKSLGANNINVLKGVISYDFLTTGVIPINEVVISERLDALKKIQILDSILIRLLSVWDASDKTKITKAEVLTLYRIEGNLIVPLSRTYIGRSLPIYQETCEPTSTQLNFSKNILLIEKDDNDYDINKINLIKLNYLMKWFLQIAGLDIAEIYFLDVIEEDGGISEYSYEKIISRLAKWSYRHWKHREHLDESIDSRKQAFRNLVDNMLVEEIDYTVKGLNTISNIKPNSKWVRIIPKDPVLLISSALQEASLFTRYIGTVAVFLNKTSNPSPRYNYMFSTEFRYHIYNLYVSNKKLKDWSLDIHHPMHSAPLELIGSAIVNLYNYNINFKQDIDNSNLGGEIIKGLSKRVADSIKIEIKTSYTIVGDLVSNFMNPYDEDQPLQKRKWGSVEEKKGYGYEIIEWLGDINHGKSHIEQISNHILKTPKSNWGAWKQSRGNAVRYHEMLNYYKKITGED